MAGDWDGDGHDSFGIYTGDNQLYLRNDLDWVGGEVLLGKLENEVSIVRQKFSCNSKRAVFGGIALSLTIP